VIKVKVRSVIAAQAVRYRKFDAQLGWGLEVLNALQAKYAFLVMPQPADIFQAQPDPDKPIVFSRGRFVRDGQVKLIDHLQIYQLAAAAVTSTSTDDSDFFLDDAAEWAVKTFNVTLTDIVSTRIYVSQLEVEFERPIPDLFPALQSVAEEISTLRLNYNAPPLKYSLAGLTLAYDLYESKPPAPASFIIERRASFPYDTNLFFCQAPLTTNDHIRVLEQFERTLLKRG
jgi:hypothetical protein